MVVYSIHSLNLLQLARASRLFLEKRSTQACVWHMENKLIKEIFHLRPKASFDRPRNFVELIAIAKVDKKK